MSAVLWYHQRKSFARLAVILILLLSATVVILFGDVLFLAQRNAITSSADDVERVLSLGDVNEADVNRNEEVESKQVEESMVPGNTLGEEYLNIMEREEEKEEEEERRKKNHT